MDRSYAPSGDQVLFRKDALDATRDHQLGRVLVHQPWGYSLAALLTSFFILVVCLFAFFGTYTRKATVPGLLTPEHGMLRLSATGSGIVGDVKVAEGQLVTAGDTLFVVSGERISRLGGTQQLIAEQLEQRLHLALRNRQLASERLEGQLRMFDQRVSAIAEERARIRAEVQLLTKRVSLAKAHLQRQTELVHAGFLAIAQLQVAEGEMLSIQGQLESTQRTQASLARERTDLLAQRQEAELRQRAEVAESEHALSLVRQEQAENTLRSQHINVAPYAGYVSGLTVQRGQQVNTGDMLASLIPHNAELTAHLYVGPRQAGFIEVGQTVMMRYVAYPYQKFGMARGSVVDIAKTPYAPTELPLHVSSAVQRGDRVSETLYYRVTVKLESQHMQVYGSAQILQAGMLLDADILQDKRRLYEWALEPLYSITGKMAN